jgi:hypothetical protein
MQIFIAANNSPGKGEVVGLVNRDWCRAGDCLADIQLKCSDKFRMSFALERRSDRS